MGVSRPLRCRACRSLCNHIDGLLGEEVGYRAIRVVVVEVVVEVVMMMMNLLL